MIDRKIDYLSAKYLINSHDIKPHNYIKNQQFMMGACTP